jgi:hypothetical protein
MAGRLLSEPDAAEFLGMTVGALSARRKRRQVPYVLIGRKVMYDTRALDRWIDRNSVPARAS